MARITVEFYGIPRERAQRDIVELTADDIAEVLEQLQILLPDFAENCLRNGELRPQYLLSLNGHQFLHDPGFRLKEGDAVLILSADVGG